MSPEAWTILFLATLFALIYLGLPVGFALGGTGMLFIAIYWGLASLYMACAQAWTASNQFILVAVPLFILMAMILEKSGVAENLYDMMHLWFGPVRGGLAVGTLIICCLFAAMCGITGTATITMATIAIPAMLKRGYSKNIAIGCVNSGGGWGILMPPSVDMVVYSLVAGESVGKMFAGGVFPTFVLLILDSTYILVRCYFQKDLCPALPKEERGTWTDKMKALRYILLPMVIIFSVLGSIVLGVASPTEAASIGVIASIIISYNKLSWKMVYEASMKAFKISGMVMWIIYGAFCLSGIFQAIGAVDVVKNLVQYIPAGRWGVMIFFQSIIFLLAMVMSSTGIMMITLPIMLPIIKALGFHPLWFGVIFIVQMSIGTMTPPFGYNLFYIKAVAPSGVSMLDIYRSVIAFTIMEVTGLIILLMFPEIILWLPGKLFPQ
jgi:tripartite ATP-independent transporter DctM subunit